jgi:hypothetical protein
VIGCQAHPWNEPQTQNDKDFGSRLKRPRYSLYRSFQGRQFH